MAEAELSPPLKRLNEVANMTPEQLEKCDIAEMNLLCAQELPGSENLDVSKTLAIIDSWAQHVKSETERNFHRFREAPAAFGNSEAYYRMLCLVTVLQQDFHIRYNPKLIDVVGQPWKPDTVFLASSKNVFIHGLIEDRLGTCATMPVLYVAIGRRLGYPVSIASAKMHLYVIWDGNGERLNFEGSGLGMGVYPDEHYKQWPFPLTEEEPKSGEYLCPMNGAEALAAFLMSRGGILMLKNQRYVSLDCYRRAHDLAPNWKDLDALLEYLTWPEALPPMKDDPGLHEALYAERLSQQYREMHGMVPNLAESANGLIPIPSPSNPQFPVAPVLGQQ